MDYNFNEIEKKWQAEWAKAGTYKVSNQSDKKPFYVLDMFPYPSGAGLPCNLEGLVGEHGTVWGLNSFGFSAPYKVLDEKLGFTAQNVYDQVKKLL